MMWSVKRFDVFINEMRFADRYDAQLWLAAIQLTQIDIASFY